VLRLVGVASSPEGGARTMIHIACSDEVAGVTGRFFLRGRERKTQGITYDENVAARLWRVSEELCSRRAVIGAGAAALSAAVGAAAN
jgi:hypothetical protein